MQHKAALIIATLCAAALSTTALADDVVNVHAGDKLMVHVYNHPELSGLRAVDTAGNLTLPLAGQVAVAGSDPATAADRIKTALATYLRSPAVDVQVVSQGDTIFVAGGPRGHR